MNNININHARNLIFSIASTIVAISRNALDAEPGNPRGERFGEQLIVVAEDDTGRRWGLRGAVGHPDVRLGITESNRLVAEEAAEGGDGTYEQLVEPGYSAAALTKLAIRLNRSNNASLDDDLWLNDDLWADLDPAYGSEAYQQQGTEAKWARQEKEEHHAY